jgi:hypothetical protein
MLNNVGVLPIVQNLKAFYEKNFKGQSSFMEALLLTSRISNS